MLADEGPLLVRLVRFGRKCQVQRSNFRFRSGQARRYVAVSGVLDHSVRLSSECIVGDFSLILSPVEERNWMSVTPDDPMR